MARSDDTHCPSSVYKLTVAKSYWLASTEQVSLYPRNIDFNFLNIIGAASEVSAGAFLLYLFITWPSVQWNHAINDCPDSGHRRLHVSRQDQNISKRPNLWRADSQPGRQKTVDPVYLVANSYSSIIISALRSPWQRRQRWELSGQRTYAMT